jgi:outer membrane lipoprotein SlyB
MIMLVQDFRYFSQIKQCTVMNKVSVIFKKHTLFILTSSVLTFGSSSCNSFKKLNKEQRGAIIGVGAGGALGAVIGSKSKNPAVYAIIGSAVGGIAGTFIGKYMDKQAEKLKKDLDVLADVERVGEGIKITMKSGVLFDFNSSKVNSKVNENLIIVFCKNNYPSLIFS